MVSHQESPPLLDALFCKEKQLDDDEESPENILNSKSFLEWFGLNLSYDDEGLTSLLKKEQENELCNGSLESPSLAKARGEAIEWMLKVIGHYYFSALTAVLAVNYLDRFLHSFQYHGEKPWMTQLAAVACLSLAAKVEETDVPLLLDLQVEESKYVFESKTIQRMEILVLSTLKWKMNPVTSLSFLDYIARRLALDGHLCREFLTRCEHLILSLVSDSRLMSHLPSALASATMLHVISNLSPCIGLEYDDQLVAILGTNKEKVHDCCALIQEVASSASFRSTNKRKFGTLPISPKAVFDASFSSDDSNDSWALSKKIKSHGPNTTQFSES